MADSKISALTDGGGFQAGDEFAVARSTASKRVTPIGVPVLVYRYTVTGSDKASIDTGVDTADAGSNDWTNGDLLEIWFYCRTDNAVTIDDALLTFNNDTGAAKYTWEKIRSTNTSVSGSQSLGSPNLDLFVAGASYTANVFSVARITVPNFAGTVGYKSFEVNDGMGAGSGASELDLYVGTYQSTSALTRLAVTANSGKKFKVGTQLLIYKRLAS